MLATAPAASRRLVYAAAFFTFWSLGFIVDIMRPEVSSVFGIVFTAVLTGLTAVALVYVATYHQRWFVPFIIGMVALTFANAMLLNGNDGVPIAEATPASITTKLLVDGLGCLLGFVLSYTFFMAFIGVEGNRHARVIAEVELAREIHGLLVPTVRQQLDRFELFGISKASSEVGGDLVDAIATPSGWVGYVADVSGHGVGAGLLMGMVKSAMRARLPVGGAIAEALDDVNRVLFPLRKPNMFVTLAAVRDAGDDALEYAVAGHPPILHYRAADGVVDELTTPQVPLGIFEGQRFSAGRVTVAPGDLLAIITDGLTEVFDRRDEEFGLDRLKALVCQSASQPLPAIVDGVMSATRAHGPQHDDQTLLLIRVGR